MVCTETVKMCTQGYIELNNIAG